jgi:hypothetical protein
MEKRKKKWTKRPPAVTAVALAIVVLFLVRLYQVIEPLIRNGVFDKGIVGPLFLSEWQLTPLGEAVLTSGSYLALSLAGLIVLIAFLRVHRWSWVVLMAWTAISLMITLVEYFYSQPDSQPNYLVMASNTIIAIALNQADVQRIFGIRMDEGEDLQRTTQ